MKKNTKKRNIKIEDLIRILNLRKASLANAARDAADKNLTVYTDFLFGRATEIDFLLELFDGKP